jgi:seryl-tRNA synthetase
MLDINLIRENPDLVERALRVRRTSGSVAAVLEQDSLRRKLLTQVDELKNQRNRVSKEIGRGTASDRTAKIAEMRTVGEQIDALDAQIRAVEETLRQRVLELPNLPDPSTPIGESDADNVLVKQVGDIPNFSFAPKPHWEIGQQLGFLDFERGTKLSGSRFYTLSGAGARLQRAIIAYMLDLHIRQGYREQYLPFMVRMLNFEGAGQLPKFADNIYHDAEEDYGWVTTAEVPLTNLHRDEILTAEQLPLYYTAYTPCFRREKTSAGKDVRGIKRGHQFDKVEMYMYVPPADSAAALQKMLADAEETCANLGLTYRVRQLCSGDLGFSAQITFDLEVWAPGCQEWLEVSSVSNCGDFQARRANLRYRPDSTSKPQYVHTLNGSGLGVPRTLIAVLENYQQSDGSIIVPEVLRPWMGGVSILLP